MATCPTCWDGLIVAEGPLRLDGTGAGVLVVEGQLVLGPGAEWRGLILVAGDVELGEAGRIRGLVRAGGVVTVGVDARIHGSACAAHESLDEVTGLRRPVRDPVRSRVGPIPPIPG